MDLLLEIGTEEMPAQAVEEGMLQLRRSLPRILERVGFGSELEVTVYGAPRRLAALAFDVPDFTEAELIRKKGPPLSKARNEEGDWTEAAVGFARSQGIGPDDLLVEETHRGAYVFAVSEVEGRPATDVLPGLLSELAGSLRFDKSMRWGSGETRFSRPVRWLVAMADGEVLPLQFAGLESSDVTFGHRYLSEGPAVVTSPRYYESILEEYYVVVDQEKRRASIVDGSKALCGQEGLSPLLKKSVLDEVVQLVEWPGVVMGSFERRFLELPPQVLIHAMEDHQRYFPVENGEGNLQNSFIAVHNGDPDKADIIRKGHERVLAARLSDAEFFFLEDQKRPLGERIEDLEDVVYQSELGSMAEKSARLRLQAGYLGSALGLEEDVIKGAERAASLAKCDLVTHMVVEFPALQGVMGSIYARLSNEDQRVCRAIAEQYLPQRAKDSLPATTEGVLLSLSEKSDNLAASLGLGHVPTGSEDPYGLRRQALGMIQILLERELPLSVVDMVAESARELEAQAHGFTWTDDSMVNLEEFFVSRETVFFNEKGYRYDLVDAVMAVDWDRPLMAGARLDALSEARSSGLLERLYTAFERCYNLSRDKETGDVSPRLLEEEAEREVFALLEQAESQVEGRLVEGDFEGALEAMAPLCKPVDRLFDDVLIMDENEDLRNNRLSLLGSVVELFGRLADFSRLRWD